MTNKKRTNLTEIEHEQKQRDNNSSSNCYSLFVKKLTDKGYYPIINPADRKKNTQLAKKLAFFKPQILRSDQLGGNDNNTVKIKNLTHLFARGFGQAYNKAYV